MREVLPTAWSPRSTILRSRSGLGCIITSLANIYLDDVIIQGEIIIKRGGVGKRAGGKE